MSTFTDEYSLFLFDGFMHRKSGIWETFRSVAKINDFGGDDEIIIIKRLPLDKKIEYISIDKTLDGYAEKSISPPYSPEHNEIEKIVNRSMHDSDRSTLIKENHSSFLWLFSLIKFSHSQQSCSFNN